MADLEFGFEIDDKIAPTIGGKLDAIVGALEKMNAGLAKGSSLTKEHGEKHEAAFKGVGHAIDETREKLGHFFEFIGAAVAFEVLEKISEKLFEIGEEALHAAAREERLGMSFENLFGGNKEGAEEFMGWLDRIAKHTEFTDSALKGFGVGLLKAGIKPQDADKFIAAGLDIAAKSANPAEAMSAAISAFERASLTGRVSARQLIGFGVGVEDLKTLPQFQGQSDDAIRKSLEKGTIGLNDFLTVIAGADGKLGDLGVKASTTLEAQITHLKDLPEQFFERLVHSDGFDNIKGAFGGLLTGLDPDSPAGKKIMGSLISTFDKLAGVLTKIDADRLAQGLANAASAAETMLKVFVKLAGLFEGPLAMFTPEGRGQIAQGKQADLDRQGGVSAFRDAMRDKIFNNPNAIWEKVEPGAAGEAGEKIGSAFGKGVGDGARAATKSHSPSELFADIGSDVAAGFALGIDRRSRHTADAMGDMMAPSQAGGAPGAATHLTVDMGGVHLHSTGDGQADAEALMRHLDAVLPGRLVNLWERIQAQGGG